MRKTLLKIRKTHRYLGLIIGVQFLAWTVSGLYFSWTDLDDIHGDQFKKNSAPSPAYENLIDLDSLGLKIKTLEIVSLSANPFYWVNNNQLFDARTGALKPGISEAEAIGVAQSHLIEGLKIARVEKITKTDSHHEYRGRPLPAYAIHYDHKDELTAYVAANSGIFQRVRHVQWRVFDFLWMGHTMDYRGRDDFNNLLLRAFSFFGLLTVLSGFLLWGLTSPTLRKLKIKK